jgi:pimeloyl-ACP methyl ester carboxylesterase
MNAKYLTIDGCKIRYFDNEKSGGSVLFLSHGVGASLEFWEDIIAQQDNPFRMIAWDYPGHGLSDFLEDKNYRLDIYAQYAWQLLDYLKVNNVSLMGNSLGGAVSLRMHKQQAQRVDKLVLLNAATLGKEAPLPFRLMTIPVLGEFMTKSADMAFKQQVAAIFAKSYQLTDKMRDVIQRNVAREGAQAAFLANIRQFTTLGGLAKNLVDESRQILSTMTKPTLFIHGREDAVIPLSHSEQAHALTPDSKLIIMEDCGHTPHVEKAEELIKALNAFCIS